MASSDDRLFGTRLDCYKASGLRIMLDGAALPYKSRSTKAVLFSILQEFEKTLDEESVNVLGNAVAAYYNSEHHHVIPLRAVFQSIKRETTNTMPLKQTQKPKGLRATRPTKKPGVAVGDKRKRPKASRAAQKSEAGIKPGVKSEAAANASSAASTECCICWEVLTPDEFPQGKITANCKHELNVCSTCAASSIDAQIDIGLSQSITCPICAENLLLEDVQRLTIKNTFERYNQLVTLHSLQRNSEFYRCLRPGCGSGQYHDGNTLDGQANNCNPAQMICSACEFATCIQHGVPWHTGKTCEEYDEESEEMLRGAQEKEMADQAELAERRRVRAEKAKAKRAERARRKEAEKAAKAVRLRQALDNVASEKTISRITKPCPGNCGARIQKTHGCSHMQCTECGTEFCWVCLELWSQDHLTLGDDHKRRP